MDTSAIIDGRIADIAKTGFLGATLVIPRFVLNELQFVSDSADSLRRQRGRRGLDVLGELQESKEVNVVISDIDVEGVREVDDRLVLLGRQLSCPILTNDFNLNRVAELQGVKVLNIDLANAVKSLFFGESGDRGHSEARNTTRALAMTTARWSSSKTVTTILTSINVTSPVLKHLPDGVLKPTHE